MRITKSWGTAYGTLQVVLKKMRSGNYRVSFVRITPAGVRVFSMKPATVLSTEHFLDGLAPMEPFLRMYKAPIMNWIEEHLK